MLLPKNYLHKSGMEAIPGQAIWKNLQMEQTSYPLKNEGSHMGQEKNAWLPHVIAQSLLLIL